MLRLFVGWDEREAVGLHTFVQSVLEHASVPVSITPIASARLPTPGRDRGSNAFTWARFAVPQLCGYVGQAIFMDGVDMLCRGDIAELEAEREIWCAAQVVKHEYETQHVRKYCGTAMECENRHYPRKNWASVMLINCWHRAWTKAADDLGSLQLNFIRDDLIGDLHPKWNWLVDEYGPNPDAKILHWTAGIPAFPMYADAPHADEWFATRNRAMTATG